ncbi:MAG TPA: LPS assembly lipoprotein LptE [Steroidobacteraceae bacterium]|nr:LPS assembly lipoprotein LptE [Steroidobacteraceae bacterium]
MVDHDPVEPAEGFPPPPQGEPVPVSGAVPRRPVARARCFALTAALLVSGCGFHLEGRVPLPRSMQRPYIESPDQQSDFVQSLRRQMLIAGAHPVDSAAEATAIVDIIYDDDAATPRVLSVSAQNRPTEYQLTYTVRFSVSAGNRELLATQQVSATRSYSFDESLLLAKQHEESILRQAMGQDLADIVMRRLASLSGS